MLRWRFFEILVLEIRKCHLYSKNCFSRYRLFRESGTWKSNFWSIETFRYLNVKFSIYRYRNGIFYMYFLPGAPLTAGSGAFIFVPQTGFAEICFSIIFSPANRKKGNISFGRTNLQLALALTTHSELRKPNNFTPRTWNQRQS